MTMETFNIEYNLNLIHMMFKARRDLGGAPRYKAISSGSKGTLELIEGILLRLKPVSIFLRET